MSNFLRPTNVVSCYNDVCCDQTSNVRRDLSYLSTSWFPLEDRRYVSSTFPITSFSWPSKQHLIQFLFDYFSSSKELFLTSLKLVSSDDCLCEVWSTSSPMLHEAAIVKNSLVFSGGRSVENMAARRFFLRLYFFMLIMFCLLLLVFLLLFLVLLFLSFSFSPFNFLCSLSPSSSSFCRLRTFTLPNLPSHIPTSSIFSLQFFLFNIPSSSLWVFLLFFLGRL